MEPEGPGHLDTYFKRLDEDKAFADELRKYMEDSGEEAADVADDEAPEAAEAAEEVVGRHDEPDAPVEAVPAEMPPADTAHGQTEAFRAHGKFLQNRRARALTRLRRARKDLREAWKTIGETQAGLDEAERKLGEFRSREDQNLARIEDLKDGLEQLRQAYDQHLKITTDMKKACDRLLASQRKTDK